MWIVIYENIKYPLKIKTLSLSVGLHQMPNEILLFLKQDNNEELWASNCSLSSISCKRYQNGSTKIRPQQSHSLFFPRFIFRMVNEKNEFPIFVRYSIVIIFVESHGDSRFFFHSFLRIQIDYLWPEVNLHGYFFPAEVCCHLVSFSKLPVTNVPNWKNPITRAFIYSFLGHVHCPMFILLFHSFNYCINEIANEIGIPHR